LSGGHLWRNSNAQCRWTFLLTKFFAKQLDAEDPLRFSRQVPSPAGKMGAANFILPANSLGLMPKAARQIVRSGAGRGRGSASMRISGRKNAWYTYQSVARTDGAAWSRETGRK